MITIGEQIVTKKLTKILINHIEYIENLREHSGANDCPMQKNGERWFYSFELKTKDRIYILYAANKEERDLWVNGFKRLHGIPVIDTSFTPMEMVTRDTVRENAHVEEWKEDANAVKSGQISLRSIPEDDPREESKEEKQLDAGALGLLDTN